MGRRLGVVLVVVITATVVASTFAHAEAVAAWVRPVPGVIERPFDAPRSRFGAGHLGADLAVPSGTSVRAAGPGIVSFAGSVAGPLHVVVAHAGDLRTSYSFLATISVRRGQWVEAGDIVGTTGSGEGHKGSGLHFALRTGSTYIDPMALFRPVDLVAVVRLVPTSDPPRPAPSLNERRSLVAGLVHEIADAGRAVGAAGAVVGRTAKRVLANEFPLTAAALRGTAAWLSQHCDKAAPPANGEGGSGHRVMVVAGIESSLNGAKSSLGLDTSELGYLSDEVTNFSYAKNGGDYAAADTLGPLLLAAQRLAVQLREMQRVEPGREVDLIAHSQGGVVVEAFLTLIYEPGDRSYPPMGTVITLSSPLHGAPPASAVAEVRQSEVGAAVLGVLEKSPVGSVAPPLSSPVVRDLARGSDLMKRLAAAELPHNVQLTTLGAVTDVMVPGNAAKRSGAQNVTVLPRSPNAHTGILSDPAAMRNVRAALEGKPLPCQSLGDKVFGEVGPAVISGIEDGAGHVAAVAGHIADAKR